MFINKHFDKILVFPFLSQQQQQQKQEKKSDIQFRLEYVQDNMNTRIMLPPQNNPHSRSNPNCNNIYHHGQQTTLNLTQPNIQQNFQQKFQQNLNQTTPHLLHHNLTQKNHLQNRQINLPQAGNSNFCTQKPMQQQNLSNMNSNNLNALQFRKFQNQQHQQQQHHNAVRNEQQYNNQRQYSAAAAGCNSSAMPLNLQQPQLVYSKCVCVYFAKHFKKLTITFFESELAVFIRKLRQAFKPFKK